MGSTMKRSIFDQQTSKALKNWHKKAVKKTNEGKPGQLQTKNLGGSPDASSVRSPSLTPPRPKKFGTEDPDFTDVEADKMATVDLDANHQRRPSDSSFQFGHRDLPTDGLKYYDVLEGKGAVAEKGMTVQVHFDCLYRGITAISSRESKLLAGNRIIAQPYEFKVGAPPGKERKREFVDNPNGLFSAQAAPKPPPAMYSVTEGMKVGGKRTVIVPPEAGYGQKGMNEIPPDGTFELNIELLQVMPAEGK
ncbi:Peptidyl-prolyl cis-trans isomerase [Populus alba x Populus x berolinensis]|nr:Peptidyl-prolyl cis-trans isomerase [Populus alba x Populus x berolinensis]